MDRNKRTSRLRSMGKTFRSYDLNQRLLMPPDLREWLRDDHLALYVSDVVDQLELSDILHRDDEDLRGRSPYHPGPIVQLLRYGSYTGPLSSRTLAQAPYSDL